MQSNSPMCSARSCPSTSIVDGASWPKAARYAGTRASTAAKRQHRPARVALL